MTTRTGQFLITPDTSVFAPAHSDGTSRPVSIMNVINFCDPTLTHTNISDVRIIMVGAGASGSSASYQFRRSVHHDISSHQRTRRRRWRVD